MDSSIQIEERAGRWLARRDSAEWSESDEAAFTAWLDQSTLHVVAFVRLEAAWKQAKRLKALTAGVRAGEVPSPEQWQLTSFFDKSASASAVSPSVEQGRNPPHPSPLPQGGEGIRKRVAQPSAGRGVLSKRWMFGKRWTIAASVLFVIGAGIVAYTWPHGATYRTPIGGLASVPMADGSKVTLNTDSKIRIAVTETERRVELQQGEAFFDVAHDSQRPFVVAAGDKRIVAVGTRFSVRRDSTGDVRVLITEGRVRIESGSEPATPAQTSGDGPVTLAAGSIAQTRDGGVLVQERTVQEVESRLSWRTGHLIFRDATLADAAAEFNRYNTRKIVIADPAVADIRVSGKFRSTQFEAFVRLMEEGFAVQGSLVDGEIVLTGSPH